MQLKEREREGEGEREGVSERERQRERERDRESERETHTKLNDAVTYLMRAIRGSWHLRVRNHAVQSKGRELRIGMEWRNDKMTRYITGSPRIISNRRDQKEVEESRRGHGRIEEIRRK